MPRPATLALTLILAAPAVAQTTYQLDQQGFAPKAQTLDPDRVALNAVRKLLADSQFDKAFELADVWIATNEKSDSPLLPEAYLLRGNAQLGQEREFRALFDYEKVATKYADSDVFAQALERELDVAKLYLNGLRKKTLGFRIEDAVPIAEEIIIRINERLPKSKLAEQALMELADYYFRDRDLKMAQTAYDCFLIIFKDSDLRQRAMEMRAAATAAQYKGPKYDASGLIEAKYQVQDFQDRFPARAQEIGTEGQLAWIDESEADQMITVAQWYLRHGNPASARLTMSRLIAKHPASAAAQRAVDIMQDKGWIKPSTQAQAPTTQPAEPAK